MARTKKGKVGHKRRERLLKLAKGFRWGGKSKYRLAKERLLHSFKYAYRDRKVKKREFRRLWQIRINAALRPMEISYSKFIHFLKVKNIQLDRKILAAFAKDKPEIFNEIVNQAKFDK